MTKNNIITIIVIVLLVFGAVLYSRGYGRESDAYSVVYLSTGEVYVGQLSMSPRMELKGGYILAMTQDPTDPKKTNFKLNPLSEALGAPEHLYLNKDNVVFYGPMLANSKIAEALAGQAK